MNDSYRQLSYEQFVQEMKNDLLKHDDSLQPALNLHSEPMVKLIEAIAYRLLDTQNKINHVVTTVSQDLNPSPIQPDYVAPVAPTIPVTESVGTDDWVISTDASLPVQTGQYITVTLKNADNLRDGDAITIRSYQTHKVYDLPDGTPALNLIWSNRLKDYPLKTVTVPGADIESTLKVHNGVARFEFQVPYGLAGDKNHSVRYQDGKLHLVFEKGSSKAELEVDLAYTPSSASMPSGWRITSSVEPETLTPATQTRITLHAPSLPEGAWVQYGAYAEVTSSTHSGRGGVRNGSQFGGTHIQNGKAVFTYSTPTTKTNNETSRTLKIYFVYAYGKPDQTFARTEFKIPTNSY